MATKRLCESPKKNGGTCARPAGWGTDHVGFGRCKLHGGMLANLRLVAQKQMAAEACAIYGLPQNIEPHAALIEELHRAAGAVAWLTVQVRNLEDHKVTGPVGGGENSHPRYEPNVLIRMLNEERDRLARVAKTCIDVGVEERRVRLAESQGELLAAAIRGILGDLGVSLDDPETERVVRRHLSPVPA